MKRRIRLERFARAADSNSPVNPHHHPTMQDIIAQLQHQRVRAESGGGAKCIARRGKVTG